MNEVSVIATLVILGIILYAGINFFSEFHKITEEVYNESFEEADVILTYDEFCKLLDEHVGEIVYSFDTGSSGEYFMHRPTKTMISIDSYEDFVRAVSDYFKKRNEYDEQQKQEDIKQRDINRKEHKQDFLESMGVE